MWIKKDNKYYIQNNNENINTFQENINTLDKEPYIYLPVHNINDIFEWYRIFNNSYGLSNNYDKFGFQIHGYFSKERGQSIEGWFPNLYEVKLSTSDELIYYIENNNYYSRSVDYIESFNDIENLIVDGVEVNQNDTVLIKNQKINQLQLYNIDQNLSTNNSFYIEITTNQDELFEIGSTVILKDSANNFIEDEILNLSFANISGTDYIIVNTLYNHNNIIEIADKNNGFWIVNSEAIDNGVYMFNSNNLVPVVQMYDELNVYNQIVYTYLGKTNQNKEFYLRRIENVSSTNYSKYPFIGMGEEFIYSEGSAHLVKCRLNYDLSIEDNSQIIDPNCCSCTVSIADPQIEHPTTNPPYDILSTAFRLLFLDNTMAEKVFSTKDGVGEYVLDNNIDILNGQADIEFTLNTEILNTLFYNLDNFHTLTPNTTFRYIQLSSGENYNITFNDFTINNNTDIISGNTYDISSTLNLVYDNDIFPANTFQAEDMVNILFERNGEEILNENFIVISYTDNTTDIDLEIFPALDKRLLNDLGSIDITVQSINQFGLNNTDNLLNSENLLKHINLSPIGKIYEFNLIEDTNYFLTFNKVRQNTKFKYINLNLDVICNLVTYTIDSPILANYRQYFYGYTIEDYLTQYLGLENILLNQLQDVQFTYDDDIFNTSRIEILGSNKFPNQGNKIIFGRDYKDTVLNDIKPCTFVEIEYFNGNIFDDVYVDDIIWDEEENIGEIVLLNHIPRINNGNTFEIRPYKLMSEISDKLKLVFDKKTNTLTDPNYSFSQAYKINTHSYAYAFMNYGTFNTTKNDEYLNNLTAIIFKDFNEPRMSFLKRDRNFLFDNDPIINVAVATTNDIDINTPPTIIDGYTLQTNDLILVKNQNNLLENGIYLFDGSNLINENNFSKKIYYNINNGTINENKTFRMYYDGQYINNVTTITFYEQNFKTKSDPRLTLTPVEMCKLGVDNLTSKCTIVNSKYDIVEDEENLVTIQTNVNVQQQIRFIDGLTEFNILNDIDGQGQYSWILNENVITQNAVVGCTQTNGPGTGDLIWYTGTWVQGIWCDGIWIQGTWIDGTWLNGTFNAFPINDFYYFVTYDSNLPNNNLSIWENGTWYNGTFNSGIILNILWLDGTFNDGVIQDGTWENGTFNGGVIEYIHWLNGLFTGGDFLTGLWENGQLIQASASNPARFGFGSTVSNSFKTRAIWRKGLFDGGEFYAGLNNTDHQSSIWYGGEFTSGFWYGGTFISGIFTGSVWEDGVFIGGYYLTTIVDDTGADKLLTIDPAQYDNMLGLTGLTDYVAHTEHNLHLYQNSFVLLGTPDTFSSISEITYINQWYINQSGPYVQKQYITNSATPTELKLEIDSQTINNETYVQPNPNTNTLNGNPFICARFNGIFNNGIFLKGYFVNGNFVNGVFVDGFAESSVIGI